MKHNKSIPTPSVPCAQWAKKLAAPPDDLSVIERAALDSHIQSCPACAAVHTEYSEMDAHILALPPVTPLAGLPTSLQQVFQGQPGDEQHHSDKGSVTPIPFPAVTQSAPLYAGPRSRRLTRLVSGIAAALVVGALIAGFLFLFTTHHNTLVGGTPGAQTLFTLSDENDGTVYAVRPSDGAVYWQYAIGHKLTGGQVASDSTLFVGSYDGHVYALRKSDGSLLWISPSIPGGAISPSFVDNTALYLDSSTAIYALSINDGHILWSHQAPKCNNCVATFVAVANGTAYAYLDSLYALRTSDGKVLWHHPELRFGSRSCAVINGDVYVPGSRDGHVYVLRASDGQLLHTFTFQADEPLDMIAADGVLYIDSAGNDVYAISASTYTTLWHRHNDNLLLGLSAVGDGAIYFVENITLIVTSSTTSSSGTPTSTTTSSSASSTDITALNTSDGSVRWNWQPPQSIAASPVVILNTTIYFFTDHNLYALNAGNRKQIWMRSMSTRLNSLIVG